MAHWQRAAKVLDRRLAPVRTLDVTRPPAGWIRAIRDALGMTAAQLGERMGVSQSQVSKLEHAEVAGTIGLPSLVRAAEALDCTVVYFLVPTQSLEARVHDQARAVAEHDLLAVDRTMTLEAQQAGIDDASIKEYAEQLIGSRRLWQRSDARSG